MNHLRIKIQNNYNSHLMFQVNLFNYLKKNVFNVTARKHFQKFSWNSDYLTGISFLIQKEYYLKTHNNNL